MAISSVPSNLILVRGRSTVKSTVYDHVIKVYFYVSVGKGLRLYTTISTDTTYQSSLCNLAISLQERFLFLM